MDNTDFQGILAKQGIQLDPTHILFDRTISVGYYALVEFSQVTPGLDALTEEWRWWDVREEADRIACFHLQSHSIHSCAYDKHPGCS